MFNYSPGTRNEDLKVGDVIRVVGGWKRIVAIRPYTGPLAGIFAVAYWEPATRGGISLHVGGFSEVAS